jgi:hypothetical protein
MVRIDTLLWQVSGALTKNNLGFKSCDAQLVDKAMNGHAGVLLAGGRSPVVAAVRVRAHVQMTLLIQWQGA